MSGMMQAAMGGGGGAVVDAASFTAFNLWAQSLDGTGTKTASVTFNTDGSITKVASPVATNITGDTAWFSPVGGGPGNTYYVRYTATVGSFTTNDASAFTLMSTGRSCTKSSTTGAASVTFTIEIATDAGGTNIVFTKTGNVLKYDSSPA